MKSEKNNLLKAWPIYLVCLMMIAALYHVGQKHPSKHKNSTLGKSISKNISPDKPDLVDMQSIIDARRGWEPVLMDWYGKVPGDFGFVDIGGRELKISDFLGKDVVVVFWATWSVGSYMEMEILKKLREEVGVDELEIVGFSNENEEKLRKVVEEYGINYTVVSIQKALSVPFGPPYVTEIPFSFYLDKQGAIKLAVEGVVPLDHAKAILKAEE